MAVAVRAAGSSALSSGAAAGCCWRVTGTGVPALPDRRPPQQTPSLSSDTMSRCDGTADLVAAGAASGAASPPSSVSGYPSVAPLAATSARTERRCRRATPRAAATPAQAGPVHTGALVVSAPPIESDGFFSGRIPVTWAGCGIAKMRIIRRLKGPANKGGLWL